MPVNKDALARQVTRRTFLSTSAIAGVSLAGSSTLLATCSPGTPATTGSQSAPVAAGPAQTSGGEVTWVAWASPEEVDRHRAFSADYERRSGTKVTFRVNDGDYLTKLLTQLPSGSPDAFYADVDFMAQLIQTGRVEPLDDYLNSSQAAVKYDEIYQGLTGWQKDEDGKIYGLPVDCAPMVQWFNKVVLREAGITTDPAALQEAGTWRLDALADVLAQVKAAGLTGGAVENGSWFFWMGYLSSRGGAMFDESGKAVWNEDPKSMTGVEFLIEQLKSGTMKYCGALPHGQSADELFYTGQLAMLDYGRWLLPHLKKLQKTTVDFDIAPMPSADGKSIAPVPVLTGCIAVNAKAKNKAAALAFAGNLVNRDGQRFRLSRGIPGVPTMSGLDDIVTEDKVPPHGAWFTEVAKAGWAAPKAIYSEPGKSAGLLREVEALLLPDALPNTTAKSFADKICTFLNA